MHVIDEKSPLAGYDADRLTECDARLFLSIEARDHAIGALVHDTLLSQRRHASRFQKAQRPQKSRRITRIRLSVHRSSQRRSGRRIMTFSNVSPWVTQCLRHESASPMPRTEISL